MAVHDGHRQRMLYKLIEHGVETMHPHEVLEILLYYAIPRRDTNPIAHDLLNNFGTISAVFNAPYEELLKIEGVGPHAAALIKMIPQLARLYAEEDPNAVIITSARAACEFIKPKFIGRVRETIFLVCLDNKRKVIACVKLGEGSVNSASVNLRRIVEVGMKHNASAVFLAHNHPNGVALPSNEDVAVTKGLLRICQELGMPLLDHIVVGDNDCVSMAESGILSPIY